MVNIWLIQPKEITDFKKFLELAKGNKAAKDAKDTKTKVAKKSNPIITQLYSSRKTRESQSSKLEEANICTPSRLTRTNLPRDLKTDWTETNSRKFKLRTES